MWNHDFFSKLCEYRFKPYHLSWSCYRILTCTQQSGQSSTSLAHQTFYLIHLLKKNKVDYLIFRLQKNILKAELDHVSNFVLVYNYFYYTLLICF